MPRTIEIIKPLFDTSTLPELGPTRRPEALPLNKIMKDIDDLLAATKLSENNSEKIRSASLLWHDHLAEAHEISQGLHDADGSFLHAIMHRREPDYPNAKYWFNRAGDHPSYQEIHKCVGAISSSTNFLGNPINWNAIEMVDAVSGADPSSEEYSLLQQVQQIEFEVLIKRFCK